MKKRTVSECIHRWKTLVLEGKVSYDFIENLKNKKPANMYEMLLISGFEEDEE